jgi:hypothetical protein
MKNLIPIICALCLMMPVAKADSTPFSTNVSTMWLSGNKRGVLAIATQRLQNNPNDIAGLVLTLQYQIAFYDIAHVKASIDKVLSVGGGIKTANFSKRFSTLKSDLQYMETNVLPDMPAATDAEISKGRIAGKPMDFLDVLQAAELDGLVR